MIIIEHRVHNISFMYTERHFVLINGKTVLKFNILRLKVQKSMILAQKLIWCILT